MRLTLSPENSVATASAVSPLSVVTEPFTPLCHFCVEGVIYRPEDGPPDIATVRYAGKWACGWHAAFHWGDQPEREFRGLYP